MENEKIIKPPYVGFGTFKNFIDSIGNEQLPAVVDRTLMPRLSGTVQSMLVTALKAMGFIADNGVPTARFEDYATLEDDQRSSKILDGLRECYSKVFDADADLTRMTAGQFNAVLRDGYGLSSSTLDRSASFFLAAVSDAKLEIGPHLKNRKATAKRAKKPKDEETKNPEDSGSAGTKLDAADGNPAGANGGQELPTSQKPLKYQLIDLMADPDFEDEQKNAVWALIQYLASKESA